MGGPCILQTECPTPTKCGENEVYKPCTKPCENSCNHPLFFVKCEGECVSICVCKFGYIRDDVTGNCIEPTQCSSNCGKNMMFKHCTSCERTCHNKNEFLKCTKMLDEAEDFSSVPHNESHIQTKHDPQNVSWDCIDKCVCLEGYVKDGAWGKCIPETNCPPPETHICEEPNEIWKENKCETFCNQNDKLAHCFPGGCSCDTGYVREKMGGPCVLEVECPAPTVCHENEVYKACTSACENSCNAPMFSRQCDAECVSICICQYGYIRDDVTGHCIEINQCRSNCGENMQFQLCTSSSCEKTCDNQIDVLTCTKRLIDAITASPSVVRKHEPQHEIQLECVDKCVCTKGYIKDETSGKCIPETDCPPNHTCEENEEWKECGSKCDRTCDHVFGTPFACVKDITNKMCIPRCQCKPGFVQNKLLNKCAPEYMCPPPSCRKNELFVRCAPDEFRCEKMCGSDMEICETKCQGSVV